MTPSEHLVSRAIEGDISPYAATRQPAGGADSGLAQALHVLDALLGAAVGKQALALDPATAPDPWRGMHLDRADVERLLALPEHRGLAGADAAGVLAAAARAVPRIAQITAACHLADIDLAVVLIVLAPDVDLKYERVYSYLQDDISRKRPTRDLVANLLATSATQRLVVLARLGVNAPLQSAGLLAIAADDHRPELARPLALAETFISALLGGGALDPSLAGCARLLTPDSSLGDTPCDIMATVLQQSGTQGANGRVTDSGRLILLVSGPHGTGKFALAEAIALARGLGLLVVDARDWATPGEVRARVRAACETGQWQRALLYVHGVGRLVQHEPQRLRALLGALSAHAAPAVVVSSTSPLAAVSGVCVDVVRIDLGFPAAARRRRIWQRALTRRGLAATRPAVEQVAERFLIGASQIAQAVADAAVVADPAATSLTFADLADAARRQCGAELAALAQRVAPAADFDALVVPAGVRAQLREICNRVFTRETVRRDWAAGSRHAREGGITALFSGPSGTGKTLAAEALAHELGVDLYRIDLAGIVSKYIGETEKNLDRVFAAAEHANAVLLFDEADALFGKRSVVSDAHDRYANIEVAYLLQKMEQFDGVAILTTNLRQNIDEAFARRLTYCVNFPFPELPERRQLWEKHWPPRAPRHADVDLAWFAREFRLSGGNIRNAVLAAAHMAASDGAAIGRSHLMQATRREYQKLGKSLAVPASSAAGETP